MKVGRGMVFGVFDGLHEGHQHFLQDAASRCSALVVVAARDDAVERIKGRRPKRPLAARIEALRAAYPALTIVPGDEREGEWGVLREHAPDTVFLGYDQERLATELEKLSIQFSILDSFKPDVFKSGLLDG